MNINDQEKELITLYYNFFRNIEKDISKEMIEIVNHIPSFKELIESISADEMEKNSKHSRKIQEDAIFANEWEGFFSYQASQGETYAKLGIPLDEWFDLTSSLRFILIKKFRTTKFENPENMLNIISGMDKMIDLSLVSIAKGYLNAKQSIIQEQLQAIKELSTPILQINDKVLIIPLIGIMDSNRAKQMTKELLYKIKEKKAAIVILDITGVPIVDTKVANHLIQTAKAVQLMGGEIIITGISPEIAETLVNLGANLGEVATLRDLEAGIQKTNHLLANSNIKPKS